MPTQQSEKYQNILWWGSTQRVRDACRHRPAHPQATDQGNGTLSDVELELELDWHIKKAGAITFT